MAWTAAVRGAVLLGVEKQGLGRALRRLEPLPATKIRPPSLCEEQENEDVPV